jgi:hydroxymethyl cephem carbamoyltransferase
VEIHRLLDEFSSRTHCKDDFRASRYWSVGHTDPEFRQFARKLSDAIFDRFHAAVRPFVRTRAPLLVAGGCGLNCGWNTRWRDSGLFDDVFVPPCTDDSGVAVGVAVDAQRHFTGCAKVAWRVDAGAEFCEDIIVPDSFGAYELEHERIVDLLADGGVVAWVEGRYEIGPRALGHRSILAAPFDAAMKERLNWIKERESYRPVAPVCREEDVAAYFDWRGPSPYMLHFQAVIASGLDAIVHDDGSARVQTVTADSSPHLHALLTAWARGGRPGVLCNTSLNFPGRGFINRMSDLIRFVTARQIDAFVVNRRLYVARSEDRRVSVAPTANSSAA